jgi:hypothetical protein
MNIGSLDFKEVMCEDDLKVLHSPTASGPYHQNRFSYDYDCVATLLCIASLKCLGMLKKAILTLFSLPILSAIAGISPTNVSVYQRRNISNFSTMFMFSWISLMAILAHFLMSRKFMAHYVM